MYETLPRGWDAVALLPGTCDPYNDKVRERKRDVARIDEPHYSIPYVSHMNNVFFFPPFCRCTFCHAAWLDAPFVRVHVASTVLY